MPKALGFAAVFDGFRRILHLVPEERVQQLSSRTRDEAPGYQQGEASLC